MREVQASAAKTHLPQLLTEVERGETIVITRHGRPIARIVPEAQGKQASLQKTIAGIDELRRGMTKLRVKDILSARHAGHKY